MNYLVQVEGESGYRPLQVDAPNHMVAATEYVRRVTAGSGLPNMVFHLLVSAVSVGGGGSEKPMRWTVERNVRVEYNTRPAARGG